MKIKLISLFIASLISTSAAAQTEILKIRLTNDSLQLQAQTTGCTKKEHFAFSINEENILILKRTKRDLCRMRARLVEFDYDFAEIGLDEEAGFWIGAQTFSSEM